MVEYSERLSATWHEMTRYQKTVDEIARRRRGDKTDDSWPWPARVCSDCGEVYPSPVSIGGVHVCAAALR